MTSCGSMVKVRLAGSGGPTWRSEPKNDMPEGCLSSGGLTCSMTFASSRNCRLLVAGRTFPLADALSFCS